jgi:hypothetical protein
MSGRWQRIGALAAALFAINAAARLVTRLAHGDGTPDDLAALDRLGWISWAAVALVVAVAAGWWARLRPIGTVAADLGAAVGVAGLLYVVVGPFISAPPRFQTGLGGSIEMLAIYTGVAAVGALVGSLLVIALGRDHRSRELRRFAESRTSRPRRPAGRRPAGR